MTNGKEDESISHDKIYPELYDTLVSNYIHQDQLIWTRIELMFFFQAAVLTAGFSLRANLNGTLIMCMGGIFTILLYLYILRTFDNRNVNLELIDFLGDKLVPKEFKQEVREELNRLNRIEKANKLTKKQRKRLSEIKKYEIRFIWFSDQNVPKWRDWARGARLFKVAMILFILLDFALTIIYHYKPNICS